MVGGAPDPVAPFSHAVEADGWIFVTGQMPFASTSNTSAYPDTIEDQTRQVMKNLITVLEGCRLGLADVGAEPGHRPRMNVLQRLAVLIGCIGHALQIPCGLWLGWNSD